MFLRDPVAPEECLAKPVEGLDPPTVTIPDHKLRIGTAGWTIPRAHAGALATEGSHLGRYAQSFAAVEINSTFYRLPRGATLARWVESTPDDFRFSVKLSKAITHEKKLGNSGAELLAFFDALRPLGPKLGPVLVQLPPKLAFDDGLAHEFFTTFRELHDGPVALEPRHGSWFTPAVDRLLRGFKVSRAMADPPAGAEAASKPGGYPGLRYYRLHGAPRKYWSAYETAFLEGLAKTLVEAKGELWVIFDNTAQGHALGNALTLRDLLKN